MLSKIHCYASLVAQKERDSEEEIDDVLWFPHHQEVRIIIFTPCAGYPLFGYIEPFRQKPTKEIPVPSAVAVVCTEHYKFLILPDGWGKCGEEQYL
jgi:hypothetical protein